MNNKSETEKLNKLLKRTIELSFTDAAFFCKSKYWKNYYCDYLGIQDSLFIWEFSTRPHNKRWNEIGGKDNVISLVSLDKNGFIRKIETTYIVQDSTSLGKMYSYKISTIYIVLNGNIVPAIIELNLIPSIYTDGKEYQIKVNCKEYK